MHLSGEHLIRRVLRAAAGPARLSLSLFRKYS